MPIPAAFEAWARHWVAAHAELWANGPVVNPVKFAVVENAAQVMRGLLAAQSMDVTPTSTGAAAQQVLLGALAKMR